MCELELLLARFDQDNLPSELSQKFKELALILVPLPAPRNRTAVRNLLDVRELFVRFRGNDTPSN
jgi:hypothetical protein